MRKSRILNFILIICIISMLIALVSCKNEKDGNDKTDIPETTLNTEDTTTAEPDTEAPETTVPETTETPEEKTMILNGEKSNYVIVRGENASDKIIASAENFAKKLSSASTVPFKAQTDSSKSDFEILIGKTNRPETGEVMKSLDEYGYAVELKNNKLVIVGSDDNMTVIALYEFENKIMKNPDKFSKGHIEISTSDCFTVRRDMDIQLSEIITNSYTYEVTTEKVVHSIPIYPYTVAQGAASDGTYVYLTMRTGNDSGAKIMKYRLSNGKFVASSDKIYLGHANDLTYDAARKQLVAAHGHSEGKTLTLIDAETLEYIKDITISQGSGAITYSVAKDRYAISQGGSTLHMFTNDFQYIKSFRRTIAKGYTAQGMGSDEDYIYFPMSGPDDNILQVYSWSGKYETTVHIPLSIESESMFWVNNTYYVAFNHNGSEVYRLGFNITFE